MLGVGGGEGVEDLHFDLTSSLCTQCVPGSVLGTGDIS